MIQALAQALEQRGYTQLTPVQEAVIDPNLEGADLLVSAQTGSGKTLGFGLAIAPTILQGAEVLPKAVKPLALVIAPTRELAMQVKNELTWLYKQAGAVMASCVGGMDMRDERRSLERGAHIVVATPGRLRDHIMRGSIDLSEIRAVVLDEADEMLDLGFREDLEFILGEAPDSRQTLLFSATVPKSIATLAQNYQKDAVRVKTISENKQHTDIEYRVMSVSPRDAENAIINTLRYFEAPNAIVFCNTRAMVNRLTTRLSNRGLSVVALSGELTQSERTHALQAMRDGRARVCVATDVAARGIDLPNLDLVVHAELPSNHETLLHRSGRTGRAGRKGVSAMIVPPSVRKKAQRILGSAKLTAEWGSAPTADEVRARDNDRMMSDPAWEAELSEKDLASTAQLLEKFTAQQVAAAFLRMYNKQYSAPEDLQAFDDTPKPRVDFGPSVWFSIPGGRQAHAEPRRILPMVCDGGNVTKDDIGAIRIQNDASYFEIRKASVDKFLSAVGPDMVIEDGVTLTKLDAMPDFAARSTERRSGPKPRWDDKPRKDGRPRKEEFKAREDRPKRDDKPKWDDKPRSSKAGGPVDWNDDPAPKPRKPKPSAKPNANRNPDGKKPFEKKRTKSDAALADGSLKTYDPKKPKGGKPSGKPAGKPKSGGPKGGGLKTPVGKPNSKKNQARAAAKAAAAGKSKTGGMSPPKR